MNAPTKIQPETVGQLIQKQIPAIAMVVGGSTKAERERRAERFARICLTAVRNTPKLANCTMESFAASMMICAQLDLEPNTPQQLAFLIPFEIKRLGITECQFQVGYRGLLQLAYRSGMITSFNADVVYKSEVESGMFRYRKGIVPTIEHDVDLLRPELRGGEIVAAYAACMLVGGQPLLRVVDAREIERAQKTSASLKNAKKYGNSDSSPWQTSPEAMWMKTAIKRLAAWMPQTEMLALAVDTDDKSERGESLAPEKSGTEKLNDALANAVGGAGAPQAIESGNDGEVIDMATGEVRQPEPVEAQQEDFAQNSRTQTQSAPPTDSILCPRDGQTMVTEGQCASCRERPKCPEWNMED